MKEFLIFSTLIYGALFLGWAIRKTWPSSQAYSRSVSHWTVLLVETPMIVLIYWGVRWKDFAAYFWLPLIALLIFSVSGVFGYLFARSYRRERSFTGAFTVSSMLSNVGPTLGGFLCLLYFGSEGLLLSQIYTLLTAPYFFIAVILVARMFSSEKKIGITQALKANFSDPIAILPTLAIVAGMILGFGGVPYPRFLELTRKLFVYTIVVLYSLSFGLGMQVRLLFKGVKNYFGMLPVKFVFAPAAGALLAVLAGYTLKQDPLAFKVIIVQSAMPVAIWSVVACKLFKLDENLAVGLWIFTTVITAGMLPFIDWLSRL